MLPGDLGTTGSMLCFWKSSTERQACDKTDGHQELQDHLNLWHFSKRLHHRGTATVDLAQ